MLLLLLEALAALVILLLIVWWTMFSGRKRGEIDHAATVADHDDPPQP
jgi:cbb3-type cytochrome oxidase subunit 3